VAWWSARSGSGGWDRPGGGCDGWSYRQFRASGGGLQYCLAK